MPSAPSDHLPVMRPALIVFVSSATAALTLRSPVALIRHAGANHLSRGVTGGDRVCVADLPGYGDSSAPTSPTLASLLDSTQQTLDTLVGADTPIMLAGFSLGGLVAARLARGPYVTRRSEPARDHAAQPATAHACSTRR
ncbi:MAG: alpha/beta fold hydrolase [Ideonella sp.]|nr:alpha/beta fold hydrolase [Ideonella sp.]